MDKKVLLIEDDDLIRDLYKTELDRAGIVTDAYATGKEGLNALKQKVYDLILLDLMLPDVNGLEVLKNIKQDERTKNTPVLVITNLGQETVIKQAFTLGADGYLIKLSYTLEQIIQEVKNVLEVKSSP